MRCFKIKYFKMINMDIKHPEQYFYQGWDKMQNTLKVISPVFLEGS